MNSLCVGAKGGSVLRPHKSLATVPEICEDASPFNAGRSQCSALTTRKDHSRIKVKNKCDSAERLGVSHHHSSIAGRGPTYPPGELEHVRSQSLVAQIGMPRGARPQAKRAAPSQRRRCTEHTLPNKRTYNMGEMWECFSTSKHQFFGSLANLAPAPAFTADQSKNRAGEGSSKRSPDPFG